MKAPNAHSSDKHPPLRGGKQLATPSRRFAWQRGFYGSTNATDPRKGRMRFHYLFVSLLALSTSCVRTTIRSGKMPGEPAPGWDERWNHAFLLGQVQSSAPVVPDRVCPQGWAQLETALDPLQTAVAIVTLGIYTPTTVSVICRAEERLPR